MGIFPKLFQFKWHILLLFSIPISGIAKDLPLCDAAFRAFNEERPCYFGQLDKTIGSDCNCVLNLSDNSTAKAPAASKSNNIPSTGNTDVTSACENAFREQLQACKTGSESAKKECNENENDMVTGTMDKFKDAAKTATLATAPLASAQASCSKLGALSAAANGAIAYFDKQCTDAMQACITPCQNLSNNLRPDNKCFQNGGALSVVDTEIANGILNSLATKYVEWDSALATCRGYSQKLAEAQQALSNTMSGGMSALNCKAASSGTPAVCAQYPNLPSCQAMKTMDCTNPQIAASNPVCICRANPTAPSCQQNQNASNNADRGGLAGGPATGNGNNPNINPDFLGSGEDVMQLDPNARRNNGPAENIGGHMGGGANLGGGNGGGNGGGGGGRPGASPNEPPQVNAGYIGGGAGFGPGSGSSRSGNSNGNGQPNSNGKPGPNLRDFLPGGRLARGVAGMTGADGITGANGMSIWEKISNRYNAVRPTLMP